MGLDSAAILILSVSLEATILVRAARSRLFIRFPFFCSYMAYVLCGALFCTVIFYVQPERYATVFWFHLLLMTLAEFAVLLELTEEVFRRYPVVRRMGRFIVVGICLSFFALSIVPSILEHRPSDLKFLDLMKLSSLAKGVAIAALLGFARKYHLALGRPVAGIVLGFAVYFAVSIANYAAAGEFGRSLYAQVLWRLAPLSYAVSLLIWTVSLWHYKAPATHPRVEYETPGGPSLPVREQLRRFNASLTRVLRRK